MSTDQQYATPATTNGLSTAGFVTGLLGLLLSWIPIAGIVLGVLGVVLGGVGVSQGKRTGAKTALGVAGVVLGALAVVIAVVLIAVVASDA